MLIFSSCFLLVSAIVIQIYIKYLETCHLAWFNNDYYIYFYILLCFSAYCFILDFRQRFKNKK
ncbi:hypothetical protein C815_01921 [Firmicutes bacterium M10-2]|nr:hypothetical protein C815_01921 [Firmicutes bacterium M10-2]